MTPFETLTLATYFFVLIVLAIYGWHRYYLVYLYMRNRDKEPKAGPPLDPLPVVTIQLPLYNGCTAPDRWSTAGGTTRNPPGGPESRALTNRTTERRSIPRSPCGRLPREGPVF